MAENPLLVVFAVLCLVLAGAAYNWKWSYYGADDYQRKQNLYWLLTMSLVGAAVTLALFGFGVL